MKSKQEAIKKYESQLKKINHTLREMELQFLGSETPAPIEEYRTFLELKEQQEKVMADLDIAKSEPAETWEDSKEEFKSMIKNLKKAIHELMDTLKFQ